MASTALRAFALLALLSLAAGLQRADNFTGFEDLSLTVTITTNLNGTAHVKEDVRLAVQPGSAELYKQSIRSTRLTIEDWKNATGSKNLRYHVLGANFSPANTRLFPQPLTRLQFVDTSIAVISIEYDTSGPIFTMEEVGPRRTQYTLIGHALSFENAPEGQVIPENTVLTINVLPNSRASLSAIFPRPTYPAGDSVSSSRYYMWNATGGAIPLTPMLFSFVTEESLDQEVSEYFNAVQASVTDLVFSNYGVLAVFVAIVLGALYFVLRQAKAI